MKRILLSILFHVSLLLLSFVALAQKPTLTTFTPAVGAIVAVLVGGGGGEKDSRARA